ncbi:MAG: imidazolonepropionase [Deltaproteobacteria bacterium]|nr:imidazolonepropionase [Deltaproteobacteria bacterium]
MSSLLLTNISRLVTMSPAKDRQGPLGIIENAAVLVTDGRIAWVGKDPESHTILRQAQDERLCDVIDAQGAVVMPGLIDCHTHLVHAGTRHNEFKMRSEGKSYQQIAADGGGIMSTVRATRAASEEALFEEARTRADEALKFGVTCLEIKSGYGLDVETELKILRVAKRLRESHAIDVHSTFLGAHVVPLELRSNRTEYIRQVIEEMIPLVAKEKLASACDIFVEDIAFSKDEARLICAAAKKYGLGIRLHVDQFQDVDGGRFATEVGATNADHLDHLSDEGIRAMAKAGVVGVILPGATFFTGGKHSPPARKMIDMGMTVAIATDYNPGTNPCLNLWLMATMAVTQMGMTCDEALQAITINAAKALNVDHERGSLEVGKVADLILLDAPDEYFPLYRYDKNLVRCVVCKAANENLNSVRCAMQEAKSGKTVSWADVKKKYNL